MFNTERDYLPGPDECYDSASRPMCPCGLKSEKHDPSQATLQIRKNRIILSSPDNRLHSSPLPVSLGAHKPERHSASAMTFFWTKTLIQIDRK